MILQNVMVCVVIADRRKDCFPAGSELELRLLTEAVRMEGT